MFETIQAIQRGAIFDRSQFTRRALKELRQRAAQDDGVACYWLGLYYLGPLKTGRSKALAFFTRALSLAQKTGDIELEADARRKLLVIEIRNFFKKYALTAAKVNQFQEIAHKELLAISSLYDSREDAEGATALFCDFKEAFLPINFAMLGVATFKDEPRETETTPNPGKITPRMLDRVGVTNPALMERVHFLNAMHAKITGINQAMKKQYTEKCRICKGCPAQQSNKPTDQSTTDK